MAARFLIVIKQQHNLIVLFFKKVVKFLLSKGARPDLRDAEGAYPLHKAAFV